MLQFMGSQRIRHDQVTSLSLALSLSLVTQSLPAMQETGVHLLDREDSLEKEMVIPSSILV